MMPYTDVPSVPNYTSSITCVTPAARTAKRQPPIIVRYASGIPPFALDKKSVSNLEPPFRVEVVMNIHQIIRAVLPQQRDLTEMEAKALDNAFWKSRRKKPTLW